MEPDVAYLKYLNERDNARKLQADGIAAAKARGIHCGRPAIKPPKNFAALVKRWESGELRLRDLLGQIGLKKATFYRRLREYRRLEDKT